MRRSAITLTASFCILTLASGCSLFGKKKDQAAADPYDPAFDTTAEFDNYPVYQPLPEPAQANTYPVATNTLAASTDMGGGSRVHTVAKRDTLYSISRMYYNGDQTKWKTIYEANRGKISNPNMIRVGQELVIP